MKRAILLMAVLASASFVVSQAAPTGGQQQSPSQQQPPSASPQSQSGQTTAPASTGQTGAAPAGAATPAAPPSKGAPQAKTQEEFKAYQDVAAKTDTGQMEQGADEFAQKYPNSDLRTVLYNQLLNVYRNGGATDKSIAVGRKSLAIDPTDPVPNVMVALALAQSTKDTDLDRDDRLNEATRDAQRAIDNVETGMAIPPNTPPDKVAAAKNSIVEMAYETLGTVAMMKKDYAAAETAFRKGLDVNKTEPDGVLYLRLAIALDNQKKYPEALQATESAIKFNQPGSEAQNLANQEKVRLQKLVGNTPAAAPAPATSQAPPAQ